MKLHMRRDELVRALTRVQGIVEKRTTNPLIANVLLSAEEATGLVVTATDTEISFVGTYEAEVEEGGTITLEAKHLFDIARNLPTEEVSMASAEDAPMEIEIRSGAAYFRVKGMSGENFPPVPRSGSDVAFHIGVDELRQMIECTAFSISTDDTRTGLNGASLEASAEGRIRIVATDGHRLSLVEGVIDGTLDRTGTLLPRKGMTELRKLADKAEGTFDVSFAQNQALFALENQCFSMRLLEGSFPDYRQVIPSDPSRAAILPCRTLQEALRRVSILSAERSHNVRMTLGEGILGLSSSHSEFGSASEELEAEIEGEPLDVGFNARYFLDVLAVTDAEQVRIEFGDSLSPCLIRPAIDGEALFVIMPMRLD